MLESSFMAACREFFGIKSGQSMIDFAKEVKELTPEDREYFKVEFAKIGISITNP